MATERLSMRKTREILRLKWVLGRSHREITRALSVSLSTVSETATRAKVAGVDWAAVEQLDDAALEAKLYPPPPTATTRPALPDPAKLDLELRKKGVTLRLLHHEYLTAHPDGYGYTAFAEAYREWRRKRKIAMRQEHRAGDKVFVDYAGMRPTIVDRETGARASVELFVAVLGASNYTYAEATYTQKVPDWLSSHVRAFEFFGGVPAAVVPDQLKSGVTQADRYEPGIQRGYAELGEHYGIAIIPARPAHPQDKAKVEVGVQIAERWILACLRNQVFYSLGELNARIRELLDELNARVMRRYGVSRRALFEQLDKPALRALPTDRFVCGEWKRARVHIDYHVEYDHHYYSVPYQLSGEEVWVRATAMTIEVYHRRAAELLGIDALPVENQRKRPRVASHVRSYKRGAHTTDARHLPTRHREHAEWTPDRLVRWAASVGPNVGALVEKILAERRHPEHGYRSCLGIMRLEKKYGAARLDAACERVAAVGARSYKHVESVLRLGLDQRAPNDVPDVSVGEHENVRGRDYYH